MPQFKLCGAARQKGGKRNERKEKFKLGLLPKLIIAIIVGILFGQFLPEGFCRFVVTLSSFFSQFLSFIIPLMILAYVTMGIANLKSGAGKLLLITVAIAYCSTLIAGSASFFVADTLFPHFMSADALDKIAATAGNSLEPYFSLEIPALMNTLSAVVTAFVLGLCMSSLRGKTIGDTLYNGVSDFSGIIDCVLHKVIIPLLPLYICGTFTDMTKSGKTFAILSILWKVFIVVIIMHLICICMPVRNCRLWSATRTRLRSSATRFRATQPHWAPSPLRLLFRSTCSALKRRRFLGKSATLRFRCARISTWQAR